MNLRKGRCLENECFCENDNDVVEPTVVFFQKILPKLLYDSNNLTLTIFSRFSLLVLSNKEFRSKLQKLLKNMAFL